MRLIFCFLVFALLAITARADSSMSAQIHDLDFGDQINDEPLLFLTNGQVLKLNIQKSGLMEQLHEAKKNQQWIKFYLNENREVQSIDLLETPIEFGRNEDSQKFMPYSPSILGSAGAAQAIFMDTITTHKESQCFNRAHVWTYEWRTKKNLYSSKTWLFFTRRYIRKEKFEWWFHVAPSVHVVIGEKVRERVMDIKYSRGPAPLQQWTNIFMKDDAVCPVVSTYSEQANYPESGSCFVMKSPMYYYQPVDLENLDNKGIERTVWDASEVKQAYLEAFDVIL